MPTYATDAAQARDTQATATLQAFNSQIEDQTFKVHPFLEIIKKNKQTTGFGRDGFEVRLKAGRNPNAKWAGSSSEGVDFTSTAKATWAKYDGTLMFVPVMEDEIEKSRNSGKEQIVDLIQLAIEQAIETGRDFMSEAIYSDGSNNMPLGLTAAVPDVSGSNTYGGLAEASTPFWNSVFESSAGAYSSFGYGGSDANDKFTKNLVKGADNGKNLPNLILSHRDQFLAHVKQLKDDIRYQSKGTFGDVAKLDVGAYGIPWVWDNQAPVGSIYFLHMENFIYFVDPNFDMKWVPMGHLGNRPLQTGRVLVHRMQWGLNRRNTQVVTTGWT